MTNKMEVLEAIMVETKKYWTDTKDLYIEEAYLSVDPDEDPDSYGDRLRAATDKAEEEAWRDAEMLIRKEWEEIKFGMDYGLTAKQCFYDLYHKYDGDVKEMRKALENK